MNTLNPQEYQKLHPNLANDLQPIKKLPTEENLKISLKIGTPHEGIKI
jgi:hypothetical protein